jgi:hypothetical protein
MLPSFDFALAGTLFCFIPDRSSSISGKSSLSLLLSLFGSALAKLFFCFMPDRSSSISGKSSSSSLFGGFRVAVKFSPQMLDTIIATANLDTYLAFERYHFCNADLSDYSGMDRARLGIWSYHLSKDRSVD